MDEKKSNSKKIIIIVAVVIILVIGGIAVVASSFIGEVAGQQAINSEIEKINQTGEVDQEIKAKGKYGEVEKVLKDYVLEYQAAGKEIQAQYQNEKFATILTVDNLKNDGPEFTESKKLVADTRAKGEEVKTKLAEMVSDEYKEKRATDNGLTGKYKDLFVDSIKFEAEQKQVNASIDSVNNYLEKLDEIFNFLNENKDKWEIRNDKVEFSQMTLVTKYNSLIQLASIAAQKIK